MAVRFRATTLLCLTAALLQTSMAFSAEVEQSQTGPGWSGVYVGFGGGAGAVVFEPAATDGVDSVRANGLGGEGVFGEVTVGYDHMLTERFLVGGFIDAHYGNIGSRGSFTSAGDVLGEATLTNTIGFDALARIGYLMTPQTLGYVLGGYGWQHFEADANIPDIGIPLSFNEDRGGYVVGAGLETWIASNWTLKAEYRYANYGDDTVLRIDDVDISVEPSTHTIHVGANYRFGGENGGGALFAAPAYEWTATTST